MPLLNNSQAVEWRAHYQPLTEGVYCLGLIVDGNSSTLGGGYHHGWESNICIALNNGTNFHPTHPPFDPQLAREQISMKRRAVAMMCRSWGFSCSAESDTEYSLCMA